MASLKWISKAYFKRKERLERLSYRHQLAFDHLKEESGLIYVHLDDSTKLFTTLQVIDQKGRPWTLDLNDVPFVIQKKAELAFSVFDKLKQREEWDKIQDCFKQLYVLFNARTQKGITDRLQTLHNNYGFLEGKAIQIDLGGIMKDEKIQKAPEKEIKRIFSNFIDPIRCHYPEFLPYLFNTLND